MSIPTIMVPTRNLLKTGLSAATNIHYQLSSEELVQQCVALGQGTLSDSGALVVETGEFTGRSPLDKFIVKDRTTTEAVHWNNFNIAFDPDKFEKLRKKVIDYLGTREEIWVRDAFACADPAFRLNIRVVNENSWSNLFVYNMFIRPSDDEAENFEPEWHILHAPGFKADPAVDGTRQHNFAIISFEQKIILIGGTGYTGEIKKGIFSVLNFILPYNEQVLSMHCSANVGSNGDTAIFFGLSGTGKTTLSADPQRMLIGDDEHGWTNDTVFNFEGGCYAKTIDLSEEKEPEIFQAIRQGALVENTRFFPGTNTIDFSDKSITENTRVSYPLSFISNALEPSIGHNIRNIFFLTADAYGILPPISKLSPAQAMYQFISGYTAKVAGTEAGVVEPKSTFSACFGAPFLPLHPGFYAEMLGRKLKENGVNVWMINTGWSGGGYGVGQRIKLAYTRAMITAALCDKLNDVSFKPHPVFGMLMPETCPGVPAEILDPRNTWSDKNAYDDKAQALALEFVNNFRKYEAGVSVEIKDAAPVTN